MKDTTHGLSALDVALLGFWFVLILLSINLMDRDMRARLDAICRATPNCIVQAKP